MFSIFHYTHKFPRNQIVVFIPFSPRDPVNPIKGKYFINYLKLLIRCSDAFHLLNEILKFNFTVSFYVATRKLNIIYKAHIIFL